jgi:hypothetical protein
MLSFTDFEDQTLIRSINHERSVKGGHFCQVSILTICSRRGLQGSLDESESSSQPFSGFCFPPVSEFVIKYPQPGPLSLSFTRSADSLYSPEYPEPVSAVSLL